MKLKLLIAPALLLCAFAARAEADDHTPPPDHPRHAEFCKENPATCERAKEKRAEHKQWCEQNPQRCDAIKQEGETRRLKMKEKCDANPEACAEKKEKFRERMKERREKRAE